MGQKLTGYPSIDKPWLKYYSEEAINAPLPECTIYEYLWENNKEHLDDVALVYFARKITYRDLFRNIDKTANAFSSIGIGKGDVVTIQSLSLPQVVYMIYALSKLGAIANLIYATSTTNEVIDNLNQTKSKVFVTIDSIYAKFKSEIKTSYLQKSVLLSIDDEMPFLIRNIYRIKTKSEYRKSEEAVIYWNDFMRLSRECASKIKGRNEDTVVMVYTGGTTGKSKAVMLSNYNLNVAALQYVYLGFERQKKFLSVLPPFIAFGITVSMHMPLAFGLKTILGVATNPTEISGFVEKYKPNYLICGTVQAEKMMEALKDKKIDLSFLICLSVGGDTLSAKLEERLNDFLSSHNSAIKVAQGYAMSETSASTAASTYTMENVVFKNGTIGVPLVYTCMKIVDEDNKELPYNEAGEICISAPCVMQGYYENEAETNNILKKHEDGRMWVHTGDIGSIDENGFVTIVGRIKRMIITVEDGVCHKVFPKLLEEALLTTGCIKEISIVGKEHTEKMKTLIAFVVLEENNTEESMITKLQQYALENFESYECPVNYIVRDRLPRTTIGKVDYRALEREVQNVQ